MMMMFMPVVSFQLSLHQVTHQLTIQFLLYYSYLFLQALEKGLRINGTDVGLQQLMLKSERALGRPESFSTGMDYRHKMGQQPHSHDHSHEHSHSHEHGHEHSHSHSHGHDHSHEVNSPSSSIGGDLSNPIRRRTDRELSDPRVVRSTEKRSPKLTCFGEICCMQQLTLVRIHKQNPLA